MKKTFHYRLYPTAKQKKALQASLDACRRVYNKTLEARKNAWEERKESISRYDTSNLLTGWKKENPFLGAAYSQCRIDVGLASFVTLSTGEKIDNPRFFKVDEKKLAKAQRRLSKAEKGTPDRKKQRRKVSCIYEKIANRRTDFAHKLSRKIVNTYQVIALEKLNIKGMMSNQTKVFGYKLNKSIGDVAWNQLTQFTTYKAECAGRKVVFVNPRNTSKMCSRCGQLVEKTLADRVHRCSCGLVLDRDENAAINILGLGLQSLGYAAEAQQL